MKSEEKFIDVVDMKMWTVDMYESGKEYCANVVAGSEEKAIEIARSVFPDAKEFEVSDSDSVVIDKDEVMAETTLFLKAEDKEGVRKFLESDDFDALTDLMAKRIVVLLPKNKNGDLNMDISTKMLMICLMRVVKAFDGKIDVKRFIKGLVDLV